MKKLVFILLTLVVSLLTACSEEEANYEDKTVEETTVDQQEMEDYTEEVPSDLDDFENVTAEMWQTLSDDVKNFYVEDYFNQREIDLGDVNEAFIDLLDYQATYRTISDYPIDIMVMAVEEVRDAQEQTQQYLNELAIGLKNEDKEHVLRYFSGKDFVTSDREYEDLFEVADMDFQFDVKKINGIDLQELSKYFQFEVEITYSVQFDDEAIQSYVEKMHDKGSGADSFWTSIFDSKDGDIMNKVETKNIIFIKRQNGETIYHLGYYRM